MSTMFNASRIDKKSLMALVDMMAAVEIYYHQSTKDQTFIDLHRYLSIPDNTNSTIFANNEKCKNYNSLTMDMLRLKYEIHTLKTVDAYNTRGHPLETGDVMTSDVIKLPSFKALASTYLVICQKNSGDLFHRYSLLSEALLELQGRHATSLINRFKTLKSNEDRVNYIVGFLSSYHPEIVEMYRQKKTNT